MYATPAFHQGYANTCWVGFQHQEEGKKSKQTQQASPYCGVKPVCSQRASDSFRHMGRRILCLLHARLSRVNPAVANRMSSRGRGLIILLYLAYARSDHSFPTSRAHHQYNEGMPYHSARGRRRRSRSLFRRHGIRLRQSYDHCRYWPCFFSTPYCTIPRQHSLEYRHVAFHLIRRIPDTLQSTDTTLDSVRNEKENKVSCHQLTGFS